MTSRTTDLRPFITQVLLGAVLGTAGGLACLGLGRATFVTGVVFGSIYGAVFAVLAGPRATTPGAGLMWGLAYALLLWLALPAGILPVASGQMPDMGMLDTQALMAQADRVVFVVLYSHWDTDWHEAFPAYGPRADGTGLALNTPEALAAVQFFVALQARHQPGPVLVRRCAPTAFCFLPTAIRTAQSWSPGAPRR